MAEISPFQGVRYNPNVVKVLNEVICPPYDIISPREQELFYDRSEYNIIRLEHGMVHKNDNKKNNKYTRAREQFTQWLSGGILTVDRDPTFYIYEQGFTYKGDYRKRIGLMACVRLEPFSRRIIFPHEETITGVKSDRLELMSALNADVSPILGLFDDPGNKIAKLMTDRMLPGRLLINISNGEETHRMWKANEPEFVQRVSHFMAPKAIYIADGHHRYETALAYQDKRAKGSVSQGSEGYNYILMTLVSFSDPGILMLPVHRVVRKIQPEALQEFRSHVADYFDVGVLPLTESNLEEKNGTDIRVLGLEKDGIVNLRLKPSAPLRDMLPPGHSQHFYRLDVSIVEHVILHKLLAGANKDGNVSYTADTVQALSSIRSGESQMAFLLNTMPASYIKLITDANDRMPRKSTYFYPKLPTGLVINRLDGRL